MVGAVRVKGIGALQERSFRPLFFARAVSEVGSSLAPVALAFAVLEETGSASDLGFVFAAREIASVLLLLVAGVWADRLQRERLMIGSNIVSFAGQGATGVLVLAGGVHLWQLLVLQAVAGGADGAFNPARNAITPQVISAGRLQQANALLGITGSAAGIAGPLIAAALVTAGSPGIALLADAVTFLISAVFLFRVHTARPERSASRFLGDLGSGWSEFRAQEWLWKAVGFVCISNLMGAPYFVFGPLIAKHSLGGASAWGVIVAANSVGWVVGGILSARWRPTRPMLACQLVSLLWPLQVPVLALHPNTAIVALAASIGGAGIAMSLTYWFTTLQSKVPPESLSRVSSYDDLGSFIFNPLGFAIAGPIGASIGITATLVGSAAINAAATLAAAATPSIRNLRLNEQPTQTQ
jgi:MFS family permease